MFYGKDYIMLKDVKATLNKFAAKVNNSRTKAAVTRMRNDAGRFVNLSGKKLYEWGIPANAVSIFGFLIGMLVINFLAMEMYLTALLLILINRLCDAIDGAVARQAGKITDFGVFLDAALDYAFYAGVIFGFALAYPAQNAVAASFLLFGFSASASAMLAYAVIDYKNKQQKTPDLEQSPFYLGGLAQGCETLTALVILCIVPGWFMPIAIILGCWCLIKAVMIVSTAYYNFVIAPKGRK